MSQSINALPIGAKIKFGKHSISGETPQDIIWLLVAKNHTQIPKYIEEECATLLTERVIDFRCYDAQEPNNTQYIYEGANENGNPSYRLSNIRQWLNSTADNWFTPSHEYDTAPTSAYSDFGTHYSTRPGFLKHFSSNEIESIVLSTVANVDSGTAYWDTSIDKVFLPSAVELLGGSHGQTLEGTYKERRWEYFIEHDVNTNMTEQAHNNTLYSGVSESWINQTYWLREGLEHSKKYARYMHTTKTIGTAVANNGAVGVRPAMNLRLTTLVTDTVDSDGCYSVVYNNVPTSPSNITVSNIKGNAYNDISWAASSDADGDALTYTLIRRDNGVDGSGVVRYMGSALRCSDFVAPGVTSVRYVVFASDGKGGVSDSTATEWLDVKNNQAPVISGSDSNLGEKTSGFTQSYTVTDAENNQVTVVEAIDGVQLRSYTVTLGATNTISISGTTFLKLNNGTHSLTITATDSEGDKVVRTYTFTKNVPYIYIETNAMSASAMPTRVYMTVGRSIPAGATFTVKVTNNANDASPVWEDATDSVVNNTVHNFTNVTKTASSWGVAIKVEVSRNSAEGTCYISSIGGNFE